MAVRCSRTNALNSLIVNISNLFKKPVSWLMPLSQKLQCYAFSRKEEAASSILWLSNTCRNKSLPFYLTILSHCYLNMLQGSDRQNNPMFKFIGQVYDIIQVWLLSIVDRIQNVFVNAQQNETFRWNFIWAISGSVFLATSRHEDILFCFSPLTCIARCAKCSSERPNQRLLCRLEKYHLTRVNKTEL